MLNGDQIGQIDKLLRTGLSPDKVAKNVGINSVGRLRYWLLMSGKRMRVARHLEDVTAIQQSANEQEAAAA